MPLSGNFNRQAFSKDYQEIEVDTLCLAMVCARLVERINNGFKYSLGEPLMRAMTEAGADISAACGKWVKPATRVELLTKARPLLRKVKFVTETAVCGLLITDDEKAMFDVFYDKVSEQLEAFLSSSMAKAKSTGRSSGGNASGEIPR